MRRGCSGRDQCFRGEDGNSALLQGSDVEISLLSTVIKPQGRFWPQNLPLPSQTAPCSEQNPFKSVFKNETKTNKQKKSFTFEIPLNKGEALFRGELGKV